eukprot:CAMPEP_0116023330 /NCGR_PEP_ID=MMETSP0321-20121206/11530_1 /TAXON_ID=163516 /ORGANISM="Leptocylindrus danicus var. danicus, Strain B650" /LENGTH=617 /DNA_ID=CAMNT_0003494595 /DNA_START=61 /DNA_END=1914 /DNA_ORIENTATION=-
MPRPKKKVRTAKDNDSNKQPSQANVDHLSKMLGISEEQVKAMLAAQGAGLPTATSRASRRSAPPPAPAAAPKGKGSSAWADFMEEEMPEQKKKSSSDDNNNNANNKTDDHTAANTADSTTASNTEESTEVTVEARKYILPLEPLEHKPGVLAQTGTLDTKLTGREKLGTASSNPALSHIHLDSPTVFCRESILQNVKIQFVATSSTACHNLAVDVDGVLYGWGRNEQSQLGLGPDCEEKDIMLPRKLEGPWGSGKIVAAATGKSHSVVIDSTGTMYAAGLNKNGQLGIGQNSDHARVFKKSGTSIDFLRGRSKQSLGNDAKNKTKFVRVACGENFTAALDDEGKLWTTGSAEYGCIGSGSTGEHFVQANKMAFADANRFELRNTFVVKDAKNNPIPLQDSSDIRLAHISCGKYHTMAIEASTEDGKHQPRVFSWGSGNFGCLGHRIQADEYYPRMIESFNTNLFSTNTPVAPACGAVCSLVQTKSGHVYYWGKHRSVGDATMYPTLVDVLANNSHVVSTCSAGGQTVVCSTEHGQTVSWGMGPYGELGYGDGPKSSSKPKFMDALDKVIVNQVCAGYGQTLFVLKDDTDEDKKVLEGLKKVEEGDYKGNNGKKKGKK